MKAEEAMLMLKNFLDEDKFIVSKKFRDDLIYILKNNIKGQEKSFFNLFLKQLNYILTLSEYDVSKANSNEVLKYCTEFRCYSLHISSKVFNIRILGTYIGNKFVFLVMFFERTKKAKQIILIILKSQKRG